ncbi:MAG: hypothetical protein U5K43_09460 [Halofilum sp. (in: g-proteobacteria)]|nr:hypothetical protein [Halofilum sp. (in: g-proteobacteria)]
MVTHSGTGRARRGPARAMALACLLLLPAAAATAAPLDLRATAWSAAARPHGIEPQLLYALALAESRRTLGPGRATPALGHPHADRRRHRFDSRAAARRGLEAVLARWPAKRVDVGAAQVNVGWHRRRFGDPARLLDLGYNLRVAAAILAEAVASTADPVLGVGRYHHWAGERRTRAYGQRVWDNYRAITFGHPDPGARFLVTPEHGLDAVVSRLAERLTGRRWDRCCRRSSTTATGRMSGWTCTRRRSRCRWRARGGARPRTGARSATRRRRFRSWWSA